MSSSAKVLIETEADAKIKNCLDSQKSFSVIAGAGSGKTTSLVLALKYLREKEGRNLRRDDKKIACITYTNRAVEVISSRLDWDELFCVSTLHKFLWGEIRKFTRNIREALRNSIIPENIIKKEAEDNGGQSKRAIAARIKIASLKSDLENLDSIENFIYNDSSFSNYSDGFLSHDDVINVAAYLISEHKILRNIIGQRYPYIFVDEAQDTFENVVEAFNILCENEGLPIVGYFGDPMQQIYDKRAGEFSGPQNSILIAKEENFRCSRKVIDLLNAFREDIHQFPAGSNAEVPGSVEIRLVTAEEPAGDRKKYTEDQIIRASQRFEEGLDFWDWRDREDIKHLFLVRQMIARRLGFSLIQNLFTGIYASSKAQDEYEKGEHYLLKPFTNFIYPLVRATQTLNSHEVIDILKKSSPAFDPDGENANCSLEFMRNLSTEYSQVLSESWTEWTLGEVLKYCRTNNLCKMSERLVEHLERNPREEEYDPNEHESDKGDWLADIFFKMPTVEIGPFVDFINENTPASTQHGVKGEEYKNVLVVFDDTEAAWRNYSFTKTLTPNTSGDPTDGQYNRSSKLAYVCFSRAEINLRILLFTPDPNEAASELISNNLFSEQQISIAS